jgi:hypothetical protein
MPSSGLGGEEITLLELDRNAHRQRVVSQGIEADEKTHFVMDAEHDCYVDPGRVSR